MAFRTNVTSIISVVGGSGSGVIGYHGVVAINGSCRMLVLEACEGVKLLTLKHATSDRTYSGQGRVIGSVAGGFSV